MGCDIHDFVEVRKDENSPWESACEWSERTYDADGDIDNWGGPAVSYMGDRCYALFAILADVRNGDEFVPIDQPRGIPDDADVRIRTVAEEDLDGHSHSYVTLRELLDYDWTQTVKRAAIVSGKSYFHWSRWDRHHGESPDRYWQAGGSGREVTEAEMEATVQALCKLHGGAHAVSSEHIADLDKIQARVTWEQPYYKCVRKFWSDTIPRLLRLGDPDNVRIVFYFDN